MSLGADIHYIKNLFLASLSPLREDIAFTSVSVLGLLFVYAAEGQLTHVTNSSSPALSLSK